VKVNIILLKYNNNIILFKHKMSVDFGLLAKTIVDSVTRSKTLATEKFSDDEIDKVEIERMREIRLWTVMSYIASFLIGVVAFTLSWSCNTALGYHVVVKSVFGVFAFFFGLTYLILYAFLRWDTCSALTSKRKM